MTVELNKSEIKYVDKMARTLVIGMMNNGNQSLNVDAMRSLGQSAYRAALTLLEVKKEYVVEKEIELLDELLAEVNEIEQVKAETKLEVKVVKPETKVKPKIKAQPKAKKKEPKKKSPAIKVEPLGGLGVRN